MGTVAVVSVYVARAFPSGISCPGRVGSVLVLLVSGLRAPRCVVLHTQMIEPCNVTAATAVLIRAARGTVGVVGGGKRMALYAAAA